MDFATLAQQCAPSVHHSTMVAIARVESGFNPFAIGVVGGRLVRQPSNKEEAIATARSLEAGGYNFSLGASQVNKFNLAKYGLTLETAFEPCANLRAGAAILTECYQRAYARFKAQQQALQAAFSCYYSGNFSTGFRPDFTGQPSYVQKVLNSASADAKGARNAAPIKVIQPTTARTGETRIAAGADTPSDDVMVFR